MHGPQLTPQILLRAYAEGLFPMGERRGDPTLYWLSPEMRGVIPLERFHVPHRLARTVRSGRFTVTADRAFASVIEACAAPGPGREESWINAEIVRLYTARWPRAAMPIRSNAGRTANWRAGLYGVTLGGGVFRRKHVFAGAADASKVALVHLVATSDRGRLPPA